MKPRRLLARVRTPLGVTFLVVSTLLLSLTLKNIFPAAAARFTTPTVAPSLAAVPRAPALQAVSTSLALRFENSSFVGEQGEIPTQSSSVTFQAGVNGQGLFMDRGNRLTYPSDFNINSTEGTMELWVKPDWNGNDGQNHAILRYGLSNGYMVFGKEGNLLRLALNRANDNGSLELDVSTSIQHWLAGQWHHVAAAWSNAGQFLRLYVDGVMVSERSFSATLPTISNVVNPTFQIGGDSVRNPLLATIDDVFISDGVRSGQEIATRMLTGLTISSVSLTPNVTSVDLYPGWTHWLDYKYTVTTPIGSLTLPWQVGALTSSAASIASIDSVTGRIKGNAVGPATITANFSGLQTVINVNVLTPKKAAETDTIDSYLSTPRSGALYKIPVAIIRYFPAKNVTELDDALVGFSSTLSALRTKQINVEKKLKFMLEEGSRFRGYKNSGAVASLGYQVVKIINVYEDVPPGLPLGTTGVYYPDYKQIFNRHNVKDLVMNQGVKEIWLEQYVNGRLVLEESNMASPVTGDVSKSARVNDDLPVYDKSYTVFNLNIAHSENQAASGHGHHLETLLTYANILQDGDDTLFQEEFIGRAADGSFLQGRCGKTDRPPNSIENFDFNNPAEVDSDIEDWFPDAHGILKLLNRDAWANLTYAWPVAPLSQTEGQWYIYWMQAMPGLGNEITRLETARMTNWWRFTADWDAAMQVKLGLTEPLSCQYTLSSTSSTVSLSGGNGSVNVTCGATCKWTASTNDSWIKLTTASGTGNGTVTFTVDALAAGQRTGTIVIADQVFTLTQNDCVFALSTSELNISAAGGTSAATFTVTSTGTSCPWTATKDAAANWLTLSPASGGTGTTTVTVNVTANTGPARTATVTVADKTLTITQSSGCSYVFSPTSLNVSAQGGASSIGVQAGTNCTWTATSNASWIQITSGTSGTGNGTVAITIAATDVVAQRTGTLTIAGQTYNVTQAGANPLPTLTSLSPTSIGVGNAAFELTVNGTNFNSNSVVNWNGAARVTTFVSATQLKAAITAADVASVGTASLTVTNTTPLVGTTGSLSFAVNNPTPVLNTLTPASVVVGSAGFTLTLTGSGFVTGSVARVNGNNRTTSFVNSTQLTISLTAAEIATTGTLTVDVVNPTPVSGSSTSGQQTLAITNPLPVLSGLNPLSTTVGNGAFTLIVAGNSFVNTSVVNWNGSPRPTTFINATQLQAAITAADVAAAGTANITVTSPLPGGGTTGALSFAINNPIPTLASLSPTTTLAGSAGMPLTLNGAGFVAASVAQVNGNNRTTSFVNSTQLTINLTAADLASAGTLTVVVVNAAPGGGTSGQQTLAVNNPVPTLTSLSQTSVTAGSGAFTLTVNGTNFVNDSKVRWNGAERVTTFISGTQLSASITAADIASAGTASITVFNAAPGGGTTSALSLAITVVCAYGLTPTNQNFTAAGGTGSVAVNTGAGCSWSATNLPAWVTINGSSNGTGSGSVNFTVAANTGAARNGTITIAGQTFTVTQDATTVTCVAQRTLPTSYLPAAAVSVSIAATPGSGAQTYAVEETPPTGWTIGNIDNGGVFDSVNGKVKWGPFFDNTARTLSYTATPPANTTGARTFSGSISVNGVGSTICGSTSIEQGVLLHPADLNDNFRIEINELTAYGTAWKTGSAWSRAPNPIDINYLTNAGLVWKLGELYHYDITKAPPFAAGATASLWLPPDRTPLQPARVTWESRSALAAFSATSHLPMGGFLAAFAEAVEGAAAEYAAVDTEMVDTDSAAESVEAEALPAATWAPTALASGTASATFNAASYTPGAGITVTILVVPDVATQVYALEDTPPLNWSVASINHNGAYDSTNKKVKWGPFFDNTPRTFTYVATPPAGESGSKSFIGFASFDGGSVAVTGNRTLSPQCTYFLDASSRNFNAMGGNGSFNVIASAGCSWSAFGPTWISFPQGSGSGSGLVNFSVVSNPGAARTGIINVAGQNFTVNQAANIAPTITPASALTREQTAAANAVTIATVGDTETAAHNLLVTATSVPTGMSVTSVANNGGTITAIVEASCLAAPGANTITLQVMDTHGGTTQANLTVNVASNSRCFLEVGDATASDQRVGSVLLYSYYTSSISTPAAQNTQLRLTNTHETQSTTVRLYFVDGQFGSVVSLVVCLPPNQTATFLMSEIDPGVTGYVIAVAVSRTTGCPVKFNHLLGGASVKLSSGHSANLSAIAVAALAASPTTCANNAATLNFDGTNYARLPRMLVTDSLPSLKDNNDTRLVLVRIGGSLISGPGALGTITGKIYNNSRTAQNFTFAGSAPQFSSSLSVTFPRLATRLDTFIPAGQTGWMRLWTDANIGLLGTLINLPANLRTQNAFASGYNLPQGALTPAVSLEIPVSVPTCQ